MIVIAVVTVVSQESIRLESGLFQSFDTGDNGLHVGGVGEVDLNLRDDLGAVLIRTGGTGFGDLDAVADLFLVAVVTRIGIVWVVQSAAPELLIQSHLDDIVLDLLPGQQLKQLEDMAIFLA